MRYFKFITALAITLALLSCNNDVSLDIQDETSSPVDLNSEATLNSLTNELGVYTGHFKLHNSNLNIRQTLRKEIGGQTQQSRITAWYMEGDVHNNPTSSDGGVYIINDQIELNYDNNYSSPDLRSSDQMNRFLNESVFGQDVAVKNIRDDGTTTSTEFYVPEAIILSNIEGQRIEDTNLYSVNRSNTFFNFNPDPSNENGLLVKLSYRGEQYGMSLDDIEELNRVDVYRAIHISNEALSGKVKIPRSLFKDIPSGGIITLYIARGNGEVISFSDGDHYFRALSQQQIRVVLN